MITPQTGDAMGGKKILVLAFCLLAGPAWAQESVAAKVRRYADTHRVAIVTEFLKLVALPNIHGDAPALQRNVALLRTMMQKRGLETELWDTSRGVPVVFGQKLVPGATRTIRTTPTIPSTSTSTTNMSSMAR